MNYVQITEQDREQMLETIGVESIDELYRSLAPKYRLDEPVALAGLERGLSEYELGTRLKQLAGANQPASEAACFLGGGAYDHFIPSAVDHLAHNSAFVTAYTPYQAEASQGALQAFFEFQTQVARLAGLDVANASMYEGATAVAEGVMLALNTTGRRKVLVAGTLHPDYRAVLKTYLGDLPAETVEIAADPEGGVVTRGTLDAALAEAGDDVAAVVIGSPNVLGLIEDWQGLFGAAKAHGDSKAPLCIAVFNPIASGLLKTPGACGADIAVGEGQPLGVPLGYGGPYLGLFAATKKLMRKMPGRLVGQTQDNTGRRSFCLTLQTREQHIRGAKATSNICTNQGLLAMRAAVYMASVGKAGLREVAEQCYHKAHWAAEQIGGLAGYKLVYGDSAFFHEFVVGCPVDASRIIKAGAKRGILAGLDCERIGVGNAKQLLIAVTEKRTRQQIEALVALLGEFKEGA